MKSAIPAVHAFHLADAVRRWGVSEEDLLSAVDRGREELLEPGARLATDEVERLVARAILLTGEPGLGFHIGLSMRASSHGHLGFAAMTAATAGDALRLAVRFAPTRTDAIVLRLEEGDPASLVIEERASFGSARHVVLTALLVGIWQIGTALTGADIEGWAEVAAPEPDYYARFAPFVGDRVRFGCAQSRLLFPRAVLDQPLADADPVASRLATEQCQQELERLGHAASVRARVADLVLREASGQDPGGARSLEEVASVMAVSRRTLKRHLAGEGTTFSEVRARRLEEAARAMLRSGATVSEVADRLGYSDAANFTRAFRRWTGVSPSRVRRT